MEARLQIIVDLSWPKGESVNSSINKSTYLGSKFDLTFPSVDHITEEAKCLGRGALLYKVDVSRAFRHVKVTLYEASGGLLMTLMITLEWAFLASRTSLSNFCSNRWNFWVSQLARRCWFP